MSLLRAVAARSSVNSLRSASSLSRHSASAVYVQFRNYAKKPKRSQQVEEEDASGGKGGKNKSKVSTDTLVPGSQRIQADPLYVQLEDKLKGISERFRKEVAAMETRASGRITPAVLAPVRVQLPDHAGADGKGARLEELATVGVRDGTTLLVTAFEERTLKYIEQGIYDAKISGVIPQTSDSRTIKIPMPKPTVEARLAFYTTASKHAEDARVRIRKEHQSAVKKGGYGKRDTEFTEFQKLAENFVKEVDKVLADFKKVTGAK
ncbi:ribosome recycling factor [Panus rudis PR-1116 ss-1]|nr:ribosome recycling factor [Panus rudis PR-1116 ss-1]